MRDGPTMTTEDRHAILRRMSAEGASVEEMAEATGYEPSSVRTIRCKLGLSGLGPRGIEEHRAKFETLVAEGLTARDMAERTGLAQGTVYSYLSRLGLRATPMRRGRPPEEVERERQAKAELRRARELTRQAREAEREERRRQREAERDRRAEERAAAKERVPKGLPLSEAEREDALSQVVSAGCARCGWTFEGPTRDAHPAFREHACSGG